MTRRLHVAFLTLEFPPLRSGGIGSFLATLVTDLRARGHRVTVVGWGHDVRHDEEGLRIRFSRRSAPPRLGWWVQRRRAAACLHRLHRDDPIDLIETHDWCGPGAFLPSSIPWVVRCHGTETYFAAEAGRPVRPMTRFLEGRALRRAFSVAAVSRYTARRTRELFGLKQLPRVLPNGVDTERFRPASPSDGPATGLHVAYVGTVIRKKGVLEACRAFNVIAESLPEARLVVAGRDARDSATGAASTWSLCDDLLTPSARARTTYLGPISSSEVVDLWQRSALALLPSYDEAHPVAWLEAMACGVPVVGFDRPWARETVPPGAADLLAPRGDWQGLADISLRLLTAGDGRRALGRSCRDHVVAQYRRDRLAEAALTWYDSVLSTPRESP